MEHVFVSGDLFVIDACWVDCGDAKGVSRFRSMFQIELDNGELFSLSMVQFLMLDDLCCLKLRCLKLRCLKLRCLKLLQVGRALEVVKYVEKFVTRQPT